MPHLIVLDSETSDLDPDKGAKLLEFAWIELTHNAGRWEPTFSVEARVQYEGPISPHAQAVHHIRTDMLTEANGAVKRYDAVLMLLQRIQPDTIFVAHNSAFDSRFFPEVTRPWICTMRAAKHVWPNAPGYGNQVLRYWLDLQLDLPANKFPHQAIYDVTTTTGLLQKMLEKYTLEQLLLFTTTPARLKTINFGKHRGMDFSTIPRDYLNWLSKQDNLDPDLKHTIDSILRS
jgi:exodeoxyribonuclease X